MKEVKCECPLCNNITLVSVTNAEYDSLQKTTDTGFVLHRHSVMEIEAVKSGMCYDCQELVFHKPTIGNRELWGRELGKCDICETTIYENMDAYNGSYRCPNCLSIHHLGDDGELSCTLEDDNE